jgi:hypothetical protein
VAAVAVPAKERLHIPLEIHLRGFGVGAFRAGFVKEAQSEKKRRPEAYVEQHPHGSDSSSQGFFAMPTEGESPEKGGKGIAEKERLQYQTAGPLNNQAKAELRPMGC